MEVNGNKDEIGSKVDVGGDVDSIFRYDSGNNEWSV